MNPLNILVRPLGADDLSEADRIFRLAFGTVRRLADPMQFGGDADHVRTRWRVFPEGALAAKVDGELVGSSFAARWGSVGYFGPLTVHPDLWNRGIAQRLLTATMEFFHRWQTGHAGLYTHANSPKHLRLYQKFDFWPRFLTAIMDLAAQPRELVPTALRFSEIAPGEQESYLSFCREVTGAIYPGLDLSGEIRAVQAHGWGDTVLIREHGGVAAFAVCHAGPGTEAGSNVCYVKFGAVRPGRAAELIFERLLDDCEALAATLGAGRLIAGVNTGRHEAYRRLLDRGFRTFTLGVAMHLRNDPGYHQPGVFVMDDWR